MTKMQEAVDEVIQIATVHLGWRQDNVRTSNIVLRAPAPYDNMTVELPLRGGHSFRQNTFNQRCRTIFKYADPVKRAAFFMAYASNAISRDDLLKVANFHEYILQAGIPDLPKYDPPKPKPGPQPKRQPPVGDPPAPRGTKDERQPDGFMPPGIREPEPEPEPRPAAPTIVRESPWMARLRAGTEGVSSGKRYASHAVLERLWSDNHTDYVCAQAGCSVESDDPNFIANHYARSKDHEHKWVKSGVRPAAVMQVEDPDYTQPSGARRQQRVEALAKRIAKIIAAVHGGGNSDPDYLAVRIAEELTPDHEATDVATGRPLTDQEILDRIRRLLDRGEYLRLEDQLCEALEKVNNLSEQLAQEHASRQRAVDRWQALQAIVLGETDDDETEATGGPT